MPKARFAEAVGNDAASEACDASGSAADADNNDKHPDRNQTGSFESISKFASLRVDRPGQRESEMSIPFYLPEGHVLTYLNRSIMFLEEVGDWILKFQYCDGDRELLIVGENASGGVALPTVPWVLAQFRSGALVDPGHVSASIKLPRFAGLDQTACELIDPKCTWRFAWANVSGVLSPRERGAGGRRSAKLGDRLRDW